MLARVALQLPRTTCEGDVLLSRLEIKTYYDSSDLLTKSIQKLTNSSYTSSCYILALELPGFMRPVSSRAFFGVRWLYFDVEQKEMVLAERSLGRAGRVFGASPSAVLFGNSRSMEFGLGFGLAQIYINSNKLED